MNSTIFGFSNSFSVLFKSTLAIHFCLGLSLNCCMVFLLLSKAAGIEASVFFALNNAFAEILFAISSLLFVVFEENLMFLPFLFSSSMFARFLFPCFICLERYLAVVYPLTFLRFKPFRYRVAWAIVGWISAAGLGISGCTVAPSIYKLLFVVNIIILAVELFCCVSILKRLRHPGPRDVKRELGDMSTVKKRAFQTVFINLMSCFIQNIPTLVFYILEYFLSTDDFSMAEFIATTINAFVGLLQTGFILYNAGNCYS